jgi:hypothetical protein
MFGLLERVEAAMPRLLSDPSQWQDVDVDYHPPRVERLWMPWHGNRIYLHRIHPCNPGAELFHPHKWPSVMKVLKGCYEMKIGYGVEQPPVAVTVRMGEGSVYHMGHPDAWHSVNPLGSDPVYSLMVSGKPWDRTAPKSHRTLKNLDPINRVGILAVFQAYYQVGS